MFCPVFLWGQTDTFPEPPGFHPAPVDTIDERIFRYNVFSPDSISEWHFLELTPDQYQYNPAWWEPEDSWHLGNMGSPLYPVRYTLQEKLGFRTGRSAFLPYSVRTEDMYFYKLEEAFSDLRYTQGGSQNDGFLQTDFGRDFANGVQFSLQYKRLFQLAEIQDIRQAGQFEPQNVRQTALGVGLQYQSPSGNYRNFMIYTLNTIKHKDTGGLQSDTSLLADNLEDDFSIDVVLEDAQTEHIYQDISFIQHLDFTSPSGNSDKQFSGMHSLIYRDRQYKYGDQTTNTSADSTFYGDFLIDERGIRHFVHHKSLENTLQISTALKNEAFRATAFTKQRLHWLDQEIKDSTFLELPIGGKLNWNISPSLQFEGRGTLLLGKNGGNYELAADLAWKQGDFGNLQAGALIRQHAPSLTEEELILSKRLFWTNSFSPTTQTSIHGKWTVIDWNLEVEGRLSNLDNFIYYDEEAFPQQESASISVWSLKIKKDFSWRSMHFNHTILLQESSSAKIPVPDWYSWHTLYGDYSVFNDALQLRTGFELRLFDSFFGKKYQPVINNYHLQNERKIGGKSILDFFFLLRVDTFSFYFRMNHLLPFFNSDVIYLSPLHPLYDRYFRLGISWMLRG